MGWNNIISRKRQLDQLFAEWRTRVPKGTPFIEEGLVDDAIWEIAHPRIMVLLKEENFAGDGCIYQDFIKDGGYLKG